MIYLILGVVCSVWLVVSFKLFDRLSIDKTQAIAVNYVVCFVSGWVVGGQFPLSHELVNNHGLVLTLVGLAFMTTFTVVSLTVTKNGLSIASLMQKMSFVITVVFSVLFYHDAVNLYKLGAVILAIGAVFLSNYQPGNLRSGPLVYPLVTLLGSGLCDIGILYSGKTISSTPGDIGVVSAIFLSAGFFGFLWVLWLWLRQETRLDSKALWAGVVLGVPNFFSLYYLLRALPAFDNDGSRLFPTSNLMVIVCSVAVAVFVFRERLNRFNMAGIALALLAIALLIGSNTN